MAELSMARARSLLSYDMNTGLVTWLVARHRVQPGSAAGTRMRIGYIRVKVDGRPYLAHRLAWFLVHGEWPEFIDHIDGDRANNRLSNLRSVSKAINAQNQRRAQRSSSSGVLGVSFQYGKWKARIGVDGKLRHLGGFTTPEAAHAAYVEAKRRLHPGGML